jgi:thioredoxin 1
MEKIFTDLDWQKDVVEFKGLVLIDFWAEWCTPCRVQGPIIEKLADKYKNKTDIRIGKLDVDANPDTQNKYQVLSIPTLIFIKDGQVVESFVGLRSEAEIESKLLELSNT